MRASCMVAPRHAYSLNLLNHLRPVRKIHTVDTRCSTFNRIGNGRVRLQKALRYGNTGWPKKVSHYQMIKKSYSIVSKPVNEIRFIRQLKV